ncbi:GGDEF domain-containing protein [Rhizobium rhizosphaerae]|uniref:GGDEF domain-containing protein n=1 Tax=Xaviernesmea rhizosphaerae TaxID=1672749 RepID=UPI0015949482|nr:GGDEF domain-containing protein [Xaviernesmea rhizosphaerae]
MFGPIRCDDRKRKHRAELPFGRLVTREGVSPLKRIVEPETDEVYQELVAELAYTSVPTALMTFILLIVGVHAWSLLGQPLVLVAVILGVSAGFAKSVMLELHLRDLDRQAADLMRSRRWERRHAILSLIMALSVGVISSVIFMEPDLALQVVATCTVFGYSAGVASRVSVRPRIAIASIATASLPAILAMAWQGGEAHWLISFIFAAFLIAASQSVMHVYSTTARHICIRQQMAKQAHRDALTGLANRRALYDAFDHPAGRENPSARAKAMTAIHCFDLDGFKSVNDRFGHLVGDELLIQIADRLKGLVRAPDLVVRAGGDEFILWQAGLTAPEEAERMAQAVIGLLTVPYRLAGTELTIGISLGYALSARKDVDLKALISRADNASYRAKARGGGIEQDSG